MLTITILELIFVISRWTVLKELRQSYNSSLNHLYSDLCIKRSFNNIGEYNQDNQDLLQVCLISYAQSFDGIDIRTEIEKPKNIAGCLDYIREIDNEAIKRTFSELNKYIKSLKSQRINKNIYIDSLDEMIENFGEEELESLGTVTVEDRYWNVTRVTHDLIKSLDLTPTEKRVLTLWVDGWSSEEQAKKLGVSIKTIEKHHTSIKKSLTYLNK